ncbi:MAG: PH domain-containing protein [bacterium]|nr:PH domain-containing protein [bacterium]
MAGMSEEMHMGEKIEKEFSPSPWEYLGWYILGGFLLFAWIIPGVIVILIAEGIRRGNKYYITNKRVIHQFTFLSRKTSSAQFDKLQDVHFTQNIIERIFGIGKVHMNTAGTHLVEIVFKGVQNPVNVKRMVEHNMMRKK